MRSARYLTTYVVIVFISGGLFAPQVFHVFLRTAELLPQLQDWSRIPFHRVLDRCILIAALVGLWPLLRGLGVRSLRDAGLAPPAGNGSRAATGFLIGFGSLALAAILTLAAGARELNTGHSMAMMARHCVNAGLAAVAVAFLEEILFRGAIYGALRRDGPEWLALACSSALYALVHFLSSPRDPVTVDWTSGLRLLPDMLRGLGSLDKMTPGLFNLALAGAILAIGYRRTGNLYFSMGLHAGWIFWVKSFAFLTVPRGAVQNAFWGSGKLIDGWLALGILSLVLAATLRSVKPTGLDAAPSAADGHREGKKLA
jgi:membrane protease YdiL (CAAX protease family)